jgi:hypothetical protein
VIQPQLRDFNIKIIAVIKKRIETPHKDDSRSRMVKTRAPVNNETIHKEIVKNIDKGSDEKGLKPQKS